MGGQETTVAALGVAIAARAPVLLWGAPGTGKTSAVRALAGVLGWPCETVIASIREPSDFAGLPVVGDDGRVRFAPPQWAHSLAEQGRGLLFLDEISTAPPAVQAALLRVVLERVVGDLALPEEVVVVAAANPPEQSADGWDLSAPLANRFCHLEWAVDANAFAEGMTGGFPPPVVPDLPADWASQLPLARGLVSAFVKVRPALACAPPDGAAGAGRGWPSPRTWEMAASLWTAAGVAGAGRDVRAVLVRGALGDGAGVEFLSWVEEMDLPDPEAVLADPDGFVLPTRGDRVYAVLSAVVAAVASDPTRARWAAGWRVLGRAGEGAPDVAAMAARVLVRCRPQGAPASRGQAVPPPVAGSGPGRVTAGSRTQRDKVAAARLWAAHRYPYLASALFASPVLLRLGIGAVAVDDEWRLYVDPDVLAGWTAEQLGALLVHHTGHLLRDHADRARALGVTGDDTTAWVRAADAEINDDLPDLGHGLPVKPIMPRDLGCPDGRLAEEYFRAARAGRREPGPGNDCGSAADGCRRDWDEGAGEGEGVSGYAAGLLRCQVAAEICSRGKEPGTVPLGLLRWAEAVLRAKVDWRRVLAAELRRGVTDVSGCVDYSYRRPSRRARSAGRVILPALRRPVPEVAVVCDTSGSMSDGQLTQVLAEVDGVLRSVGVHSQGVRVLACDAAVHRIRRVSAARQVELVGGGGTNMGAGIDEAVRARPRPGVVVVLTDGHTPWPAAPPKGVRVVVGLVSPGPAPAPPAWARAVRIDDL